MIFLSELRDSSFLSGVRLFSGFKWARLVSELSERCLLSGFIGVRLFSGLVMGEVVSELKKLRWLRFIPGARSGSRSFLPFQDS